MQVFVEKRKTTDPVSEAGRIVRDATEVDWAREPATEYERAIRAMFLSDYVQTCEGRFAIMHLAVVHSQSMASDLEAAADDALRIASARIAACDHEALRNARRMVDRRRERP